MRPVSRRTVLTVPLALVPGVAAAAAVSAGPATAAPADLLRWRPPTMTDPIFPPTLSTGNTTTEMDPTKDYVIQLPPTVKNGTTHLRGGRNVRLIGGHIRLPEIGTPGSNANAIRITDNVGVVHIEGVYIDSSDNGQGDALAIDAPESIVQVQNCRFAGMKGGAGEEYHADCIQPWGGVEELRVDKFTGTSTVHCLFLPQDAGPIGGCRISRTNLRVLPEFLPGGGEALWISGTNVPFYQFSDVYIEPRSGRTLGNSVSPGTGHATHPLVISDGLGTWPSLGRVTGGVHDGPPPGGDYVPIGLAGIGYVSPGYQ